MSFCVKFFCLLLLLNLVGHFVADDIADSCYYHAVDGGDAEGQQISNYCAGDNADDGAPFDLLELHLSTDFVLVAMHKIAEHKNDADGRQGGVEHAEEGAEVVIQPYC